MNVLGLPDYFPRSILFQRRSGGRANGLFGPGDSMRNVHAIRFYSDHQTKERKVANVPAAK
jgi:hypothetical protein